MKEIKVKKINSEEFAPFGTFYPMGAPGGFALEGELHRFYPDRLGAQTCKNIGFSPIQVKKPAKMLIQAVEYHTTTWEIILPLNDDMIIHVSPASGEHPVTKLTEAFLVPKNTLIKINAAIWHLAPLPANAEELSAMIVLPECTYANDCTVIELKEEEQFVLVNDIR
ncbi:MAG: DUF4867 family protein [Acetivibrio sp.]